MIYAGTVADICWTSGTWVFLDIGFSKKKRSCGLLIHDEKAREFQFNTARALILELVAKTDGPINLTIEAPLSVAFDKSGNPSGRSIERKGAKTRYWYNGLGCVVMVAAIYLVRAIQESSPMKDVRLFEGFVSYKKTAARSDHMRDVRLMRRVAKKPGAKARSIIDPIECYVANGLVYWGS